MNIRYSFSQDWIAVKELILKENPSFLSLVIVKLQIFICEVFISFRWKPLQSLHLKFMFSFFDQILWPLILLMINFFDFNLSFCCVLLYFVVLGLPNAVVWHECVHILLIIYQIFLVINKIKILPICKRLIAMMLTI